MREPEFVEPGHLRRSAIFPHIFHPTPLWIPAFAGMTADNPDCRGFSTAPTRKDFFNSSLGGVGLTEGEAGGCPSIRGFAATQGEG